MRRSILLLVVLLLIASSANAQYIEQGDREIQFFGSFFAVSGMKMFNLSGLYGYYKTDKLEFGGGPSINYMSYSGFGISESSTTVGATAFVRLNLTAKDKVIPFVGAQWYQYDLAPEEPLGFTDLSYIQFGGGFKYFLNEYIAYDFSGNMGFGLTGGDVSFLGMAGVAALF